MRVGFIGLGMMGKGMAANLQKAGHQLVVHDLNRGRGRAVSGEGRDLGQFAAQVGAQCEVVFTSLPVPADVEAVALGPNGLIEGMKPDTAFFDMSTNSVAMVRKIHAAFAEKNLYMLDSPVSGGPGGAASGKMAIWVGGDEQQFNRHKTRARRDGRPGALYRADRRRHDRQARAQLHQCGGRRGARRGHDDGDQGRGRAARIVGGGAAGRDRPAAHLRPARQVSVGPATTRPISRCASCTRTCRWRSGSGARSGCRCGSPTGVRGIDRGDEPRLGHSATAGSAGSCRSSAREFEPPAVDPKRVQAILDADKPK